MFTTQKPYKVIKAEQLAKEQEAQAVPEKVVRNTRTVKIYHPASVSVEEPEEVTTKRRVFVVRRARKDEEFAEIPEMPVGPGIPYLAHQIMKEDEIRQAKLRAVQFVILYGADAINLLQVVNPSVPIIESVDEARGEDLLVGLRDLPATAGAVRDLAGKRNVLAVLAGEALDPEFAEELVHLEGVHVIRVADGRQELESLTQTS